MDLTNPTNWAKVAAWDLVGGNKKQYGTGPGSLLVYDPIPNVNGTLATPVGLVKTRAPEDEVKPTWIKACRFNAYLDFVSGPRDKIFSKICGLNQGTYLQLPNFGRFPYQVEFVIPDYLISLHIELWQFTDSSGKYLPVHQQVVLSAVEVIEVRQKELERLIEQQQKQST